MVNVGVAVVVLDGPNVLLMKREDFEVWTLPGGAIEAGESVGDAAIREALEETGIEVALTGLVGIYSRPNWSSHMLVFAARPIGGAPQPQPGEAIDVGYFAASALPDDCIWWVRQPIRDAVAGVGGSAVWEQDAVWPSELSPHDRRALYAMRDQSSLTRYEFYLRHLGQIGLDGEQRML